MATDNIKHYISNKYNSNSKNKEISVFCDNKYVVNMANNETKINALCHTNRYVY